MFVLHIALSIRVLDVGTLVGSTHARTLKERACLRVAVLRVKEGSHLLGLERRAWRQKRGTRTDHQSVSQLGEFAWTIDPSCVSRVVLTTVLCQLQPQNITKQWSLLRWNVFSIDAASSRFKFLEDVSVILVFRGSSCRRFYL